jgi:ribonuclease HI
MCHFTSDAVSTFLQQFSIMVKQQEQQSILLFTDGSCLKNPGRGGWAVVQLQEDGSTIEASGGARLTTNNRMELRAAIEGLRMNPIGKDYLIKLHTDSQLVVNGIEQGWAVRWRANGWMRNKKDKTENPDLWAELLTEVEKRNVKFVWVKGHAGHPQNERCDVLAKDAAMNQNEADIYYERMLSDKNTITNSADESGDSTTVNTKNVPVNQETLTVRKKQSNSHRSETLFDDYESETKANERGNFNEVQRASSFAKNQPGMPYTVKYNLTEKQIEVSHPTQGAITIPIADVLGVIKSIQNVLKT